MLKGLYKDFQACKVTYRSRTLYLVPHWMCIGVVKGGTTSLYKAFKQHPDIWMPHSKETHFFSGPDYGLGMRYYMDNFFANADSYAKSIGEISPKYFIHRYVPRRIKANINNDIKFIVILRHPVDRAWSHYCHSYERFRHFPYRPTEDLSFKLALREEKKRLNEPDHYSWTHGYWLAYLYTGLYAKHLRNWFDYFPRENFLVLTLEELTEKTQLTLDSIANHLGIKSFSDLDNSISFPKTNSYSRTGLESVTRRDLIRYYEPHIRDLERLLDRDFSHWLS